MRLDRGQQLFPRLDVQRPPDVNLAHLRHQLFGQGVREHEHRPRESGAVELPQLPRPEPDRAEPPHRRRPPAGLTRTQVHLPALHHQLPLQRRQLARLGDALLRLHARVVERREDGRDEEREQAAALDFVNHSSVSLTSSSVSPGLPMMSVIAGNQLFLFITSRPRMSTLGHSSIGNGTPLLGMICFAIRTDRSRGRRAARAP